MINFPLSVVDWGTSPICEGDYISIKQIDLNGDGHPDDISAFKIGRWNQECERREPFRVAISHGQLFHRYFDSYAQWAEVLNRASTKTNWMVYQTPHPFEESCSDNIMPGELGQRATGWGTGCVDYTFSNVEIKTSRFGRDFKIGDLVSFQKDSKTYQGRIFQFRFEFGPEWNLIRSAALFSQQSVATPEGIAIANLTLVEPIDELTTMADQIVTDLTKDLQGVVEERRGLWGKFKTKAEEMKFARLNRRIYQYLQRKIQAQELTPESRPFLERILAEKLKALALFDILEKK